MQPGSLPPMAAVQLAAVWCLRHEVKVLVSACAEGKTEIIDGSCEELRMLVI